MARTHTSCTLRVLFYCLDFLLILFSPGVSVSLQLFHLHLDPSFHYQINVRWIYLSQAFILSFLLFFSFPPAAASCKLLYWNIWFTNLMRPIATFNPPSRNYFVLILFFPRVSISSCLTLPSGLIIRLSDERTLPSAGFHSFSLCFLFHLTSCRVLQAVIL